MVKMPFSSVIPFQSSTTQAEGEQQQQQQQQHSSPPKSVTASSRITSPTKGLHPMRFPKDERIPVTEKELHAQGIKFCFHKILAQNQCLAKARDAYLEKGMDPNKGPDWYYFHLRMCFEPHKAANQCVIDHREQQLKERQKRIREKKLGSMLHV